MLRAIAFSFLLILSSTTNSIATEQRIPSIDELEPPEAFVVSTRDRQPVSSIDVLTVPAPNTDAVVRSEFLNQTAATNKPANVNSTMGLIAASDER